MGIQKTAMGNRILASTRQPSRIRILGGMFLKVSDRLERTTGAAQAMIRTKHPSDLGQLLRLARELRGWSLRELDKRSGVPHAAISQIETGHIKEPSFRLIVKLTRALNLPLQRLINTVE